MKKKFATKLELANRWDEITEAMIKAEHPDLSDLELMLIFPTRAQEEAAAKLLESEGYDLNDCVVDGKYQILGKYHN